MSKLRRPLSDKVEVRVNADTSDAGWGRLKSGAGFIALDYAKRL